MLAMLSGTVCQTIFSLSQALNISRNFSKLTCLHCHFNSFSGHVTTDMATATGHVGDVRDSHLGRTLGVNEVHQEAQFVENS